MPCGLEKWRKKFHKEYQKERKEHPNLSASAVRQIVKDHLRRKG